VETVDQVDWLRVEGCDEIQGFLFSPAKAASDWKKVERALQ